jgi:23S rRNA (uridine2552-2'-O)-methyltransferase
VASEVVGSKGRVVGVDLAEMEPLSSLANTFAFTGDFSEVSVVEQILEKLTGPAQVLLSDAHPKVTGVRTVDRAREEALLEAIEAALPRLLEPGGSLLFKLFECPEAKQVENRLRTQFTKCKRLSPKASRKGSSEMYFYADNYKGNEAK